MNSVSPISTAAPYNGMNKTMTAPQKTWMNRLWYRRPSNSGNVCTSSRWPSVRAGPPMKMNAMKMPMKMLQNLSHSRLEHFNK